jgi:hypothetical protein
MAPGLSVLIPGGGGALKIKEERVLETGFLFN